MTGLTTVFVAILLLSLGVLAMVLAAVGGLYSMHRRGARAVAMAALGVGALAGMTVILWERPWEVVWDDVLWPLLVYLAALGAGAGAGAGLVFILVAAR